MVRPTIADLAKAADVSVSTVNRILSGNGRVRHQTVERVLRAAEDIGYDQVDSIQRRIEYRKSEIVLGVLLLQSGRTFYQEFAAALKAAAGAEEHPRTTLITEYLDDLTPGHVAKRIECLGSRVDAMAVVAAQHPLVAQAIERLHISGTSAFALISELSASCGVGYVGIDNWKVGRCAAWAMKNMCRHAGELAIIAGSHRYRCQELNEVGFRSYLREHAPEFTVLETLISNEDRKVAAELTTQLLHEHRNLCGIYVSGGGVNGVMQSLRDVGRAGDFPVVAHELFGETRQGLLEGTLTVVISHRLSALASATVSAMRNAVDGDVAGQNKIITTPFDLFTSENL